MKAFSRLATTALTVAAISGATAAWAVTTSTNAVVDIVQNITVTENNQMNFGQITSPVGGNSTVELTTGGATSISGGSATTASTIIGDGDAAAYTVTVPDTSAIAVSVENVSVNNGFSLSSFVGSYAGGSDVSLDSVQNITSSGSSSSGDALTVGATLDVPAGVADGDYTFSYDLVVEYQ